MKAMNRKEIRQAIVDGRSCHVIVVRVIAWCRKNAAKSWDTAAMIQLVSILKLRLRDTRAVVSEMHIGKTMGTTNSPSAPVRTFSKWSCDWDTRMELDIPAI